jgi:release factor glutamine methyltransferase
MTTYAQALKEAEEMLLNAGIEEYRTDAVLLMSELLDISRTRLLTDKNHIIPQKDYDLYISAVTRRTQREPLQYITGRAFFYGYEYKVTEDVLIPRMDTECLVEEVLKLLTKEFAHMSDINVLDMCTGSGCILTSILLEDKRTRGLGADISAAALKVAEENARLLLQDLDRIRFVESDIFSNVSGRFDLIVSNPPYIRPEVIDTLMPEVRGHEPYIALCGHEDGLYFYENITAGARSYLNDKGFLCYEIGYDQGPEVVGIMDKYGFKDCVVKKDLAGLDRIVMGHI